MEGQYRLAFVDDEPWVLSGLKGIIPWQEYGFEVVRIFESAEEALESLRRERVDAVFTDIRLPEMDGIELAGIIREEKLADSVVILSAYRDFDFARRAIDKKVVNYLVKPLDPDEVIRVAQQLRQTLDGLRAVSRAQTEPFVIYPNDQDFMRGADVINFLSSCAIGPNCFLSIGEDGMLLTSERKVTPISLNGVQKATLISMTRLDWNQLSYSALSRRYRDFSRLTEMIEEARAAEEFEFVYSPHPLCGEIQFYIATHYMQRLTIGSLAKRFYLSKVYISEQFKRHTDLTLIMFLTDIRIKHAMHLLKTTALTIKEVATCAGYDDASYFGRIFKKKTGASPEEYRARG